MHRIARRYGRELVSKPAISFFKERLGELPQNESIEACSGCANESLENRALGDGEILRCSCQELRKFLEPAAPLPLVAFVVL